MKFTREGRDVVSSNEWLDSSDATVLDGVRGLRWPMLSPVRGGPVGAHASRVLGTAMELAEYRAYRPGDDPRRLDWKLLARSDRAYTRRSPTEAIAGTTLVVDATGSMAFPDPRLDKWVLARQLAVALCSVCAASGDPVGLAIAQAAAVVVAPRPGRAALASLYRRLSSSVPRGAAVLTPLFADAVLCSSRVVVISDFLGDAEPLLEQAKQAAALRKQLHAVHVVAREELDPPAHGVLVTDPEAPGVRRAMDPASRASYLRALAVWQQSLARDWRRIGARYWLAITGEKSAATYVRAIVHEGQGQGRGAVASR